MHAAHTATSRSDAPADARSDVQSTPRDVRSDARRGAHGVDAQGDGTPAAETYGFVGLGSQGAEIVRLCAVGGVRPIVFDLRADRVEQVRSSGVTAAPSLADLGRHATVVSVCVFADDDVRAVVAGPGGLLETMRRGGLIVVHSTCSPEVCVELATRAHERGLALVDAPVSNGIRDARGRALTVMFGGGQRELGRCRPVFDLFAHTVLHIGEVGSAQLVKLLNNAVFLAHRGAAVEALREAVRLGLDQDRVRVALRTCSAAASPLPPGDQPLGLPGSGPSLTALAALLTKDLTLLDTALAAADGNAADGNAGRLGGLAREALATLLGPDRRAPEVRTGPAGTCPGHSAGADVPA
ncbi:NAD(P)-dependent oxidoreductase [Parafrankia elaeagni]|uniref:NAD(P)-dependent oxidoreductase n=1 Tax=Parafrankia elaeagni TaxID=222534 RepID=UPI00037563BF|nr:NAD(P)-dependent oxidoreductase [Parafrankia elaeagni]